MNRLTFSPILPLSLFATITLFFLSFTPIRAQVTLLKQQSLAHWGVAPANYSGITRVDSLTYAVIDDKSPLDGFYLFTISQNPTNGKILSVSRSALHCSYPKNKEDSILRSRADCEDIVFVPHLNTFFIAQEEMAQVKEYKRDGAPTGRSLKIPEFFNRAHQHNNGGFEALAYDHHARAFWLTTENALLSDTLFHDYQRNPVQMLRLMRFGENLQPNGQWLYLMEPTARPANSLYYAHGVSAMTALPNGKLLIMERELAIPKSYVGGWCKIRVFMVAPTKDMRLAPHNPGTPPYSNWTLPKQEIFQFTTRILPFASDYANYEGMCLGPTLSDGRPTLLLINDSQAGAGNSLYHLKDYIKVAILPKGFID